MEEWVDGDFRGNGGDVFIRCNHMLYTRGMSDGEGPTWIHLHNQGAVTAAFSTACRSCWNRRWPQCHGCGQAKRFFGIGWLRCFDYSCFPVSSRLGRFVGAIAVAFWFRASGGVDVYAMLHPLQLEAAISTSLRSFAFLGSLVPLTIRFVGMLCPTPEIRREGRSESVATLIGSANLWQQAMVALAPPGPAWCV